MPACLKVICEMWDGFGEGLWLYAMISARGVVILLANELDSCRN